MRTLGNVWAVLLAGDGQPLKPCTTSVHGVSTPTQYCSPNGGTGFDVLLPLLVIAKSDPEAGVIFIPSDHYVEHEEVLADVMRRATSPGILSSDKITMLGISPNAPDSGFGYLSPAPDSGVGVRPALKFTEKPDKAMAAELIRTGSLWAAESLLDAFRVLSICIRGWCPGSCLK
jgi:mannose-1-phosphate guanylyltransferase